MLLGALTRHWPREAHARFVITPGGFVRAVWPRGVVLATGWQSRPRDFDVLAKYAAQVLSRVVTDRVLRAAAGKADVLTIGIDIVDGPDNRHAELVGVFDVGKKKLVRWTGKSYPTGDQESTLLHVTDLDSHLLRIAGERVLVLGCHDLNMFSPRGRANQSPDGPRRERCDEMRAKVASFKPTFVLQHPHSTDTPNIWRMPWLSLARDVPSVHTWASGIAYYNNRGKRRAPLRRVQEQTRSEHGVTDIVIDPKGYS